MNNSFFKCLTVAESIWTTNTFSALDTLYSAFGLPKATKENLFVNPAWGDELVMYGFDQSATGLAVMGPTRVEGLDRSRADYPYILEAFITPPLRPVMSNSYLIETPDLEAILELVQVKGIRHRFDPGTSDFPTPRLYTGYGSDKADPWYSPEADAGLKFEFFQSKGGKSRLPVVLGATDIEKYESSTHLVKDINTPIATLGKNFGWEPGRTWTANGLTIAEFVFDDTDSTTVQFIAPLNQDTLAGRHLSEWGPGPYVQRMVCRDLLAREQALKEHGITVTRGEALDGSGRQALFAEGGRIFFGVLELVEAVS